MLRHLGEPDAAWKIRNAIDEVYRDRTKLTRDVGGSAGTSEFADAIIQAMESQSVAAKEQPELRRPVDTGYMRTYTVFMNVTLSIDEQIVVRARKKADALGKSLNQLVRDYLQKLAGGDDPERWIEEFERLSGTGNSHGQRFNRDEAHERS